jgi:hypothetical protein
MLIVIRCLDVEYQLNKPTDSQKKSKKNCVAKNCKIESESLKKMLMKGQKLASVFQKHSLWSVKEPLLHPENTVYAIP